MQASRLHPRRLPALVAVLLVLATVLLALALQPASQAAAAGECRVQGRVLDVYGDPVSGIHVQFARDGQLINKATDVNGRYDFGLQFGAAARRFSVALISEEYAHTPQRFQIFAQQQLGVLRSDTFGPSDWAGCARDFRLAAIPGWYPPGWPAKDQWPDLIEVYQRTQRAWALADSIGEPIGYGLPLRVYAWCDDIRLGCSPGMDFAGFAGTRSDGSYSTPRPYIVLGTENSARGHGDVPDNREYHEFGHYFQADLFGNTLPRHPEDVPHGGYYWNPSSSDSWTEGFAEFYSLMVAKHVDGEPSPERYRIRGAEYDVELDHLAWEWAGWWEELSVAGVLLDFEDGDEDYRSGRPNGDLRVEEHHLRRVNGGVVVEGRVSNGSLRRLAYPEVVVELLDRDGAVVHRSAAPATPTRLWPGAEASFLAPLPEGIDFVSVRVSPGPMPAYDDDPIDVTLSELVDAIRDYRGSREHGNGYVFDVAELYAALSAAFGGRDRDLDGVEDVEQIFRARGFFADLDGSRSWSRGEKPGITSHPAYAGYPAALPRRNLPVAPEAIIAIDSGGVATDAIVYLTYAPPHTARSYGYLASIENGEVVIAPPPRGYDATVTILLLADGYSPAIAGRFEGQQLWELWDQAPGQSIIEITATLQLDAGDIDILLYPAAAPPNRAASALHVFPVPPPGGLTIGQSGTLDPAALADAQPFEVESISAWDVDWQRWSVYIPGAPELVNAESRSWFARDGFVWIKRRSDSALTGPSELLPGTDTPTPTGVQQLPEPPGTGITVGFAGTFDIDEFVASQTFDVESVSSFNVQRQEWLVYVPGAPEGVSTLTPDDVHPDLIVFVKSRGPGDESTASAPPLLPAPSTPPDDGGGSGGASTPPDDGGGGGGASTPPDDGGGSGGDGGDGTDGGDSPDGDSGGTSGGAEASGDAFGDLTSSTGGLDGVASSAEGSADGTTVQVGSAASDGEGSLTVTFTNNVAFDGPGDDITIVAVDDDGTADDSTQALIEVSADGSTWVTVGNFNDSSDVSFDLGSLPTALAYVVAVRISQPSGVTPGFDVDAVVALNQIDLEDVDLSAAPVAAQGPGFTAHTIVATLTDGVSAVEGAEVRFLVSSGPNAGVGGAVLTDVAGVAAFTYQGAAGPGTDSIDVWLDIDGDGLADGDEPSGTVTKEWYGVTGTITLIDVDSGGAVVGDILQVVVDDEDLDTTAGPDTVDVIVFSTSDPTGLTALTLTETGGSTGVFTAVVELTGATDPALAELAAASGGTITARYDDALDGEGNDPASVEATLDVVADEDATALKKVTLCHLPGGDATNKQTISVGGNQHKAHLDHGDTLGECIEENPA